MNRINILLLLDRLEELIESSPRVPLTDKALVNVEEAVTLLQKIRESLPEAIKQAEWLSAEQERLLQRSRNEAEKVVSQAQEYAAQLLNDHELVKAARQHAQRITEEAVAQAAAVQKGADEYAEQLLGQLESRLERLLADINRSLQQVRNGRQELRRG
ncbi:MAG: ATPase [Limnochordales bacterium]|nr:ATPase [Limnochordales bacterium]